MGHGKWPCLAMRDGVVQAVMDGGSMRPSARELSKRSWNGPHDHLLIPVMRLKRKHPSYHTHTHTHTRPPIVLMMLKSADLGSRNRAREQIWLPRAWLLAPSTKEFVVDSRTTVALCLEDPSLAMRDSQ